MENINFLTYNVIFEPAQEGGYIVSVPSLPGCMTQADTFEEAKEMIKDAILGYLEVLVEDGQSIPQESSERIEAQIKIPAKMTAYA